MPKSYGESFLQMIKKKLFANYSISTINSRYTSYCMLVQFVPDLNPRTRCIWRSVSLRSHKDSAIRNYLITVMKKFTESARTPIIVTFAKMRIDGYLIMPHRMKLCKLKDIVTLPSRDGVSSPNFTHNAKCFLRDAVVTYLL